MSTERRVAAAAVSFMLLALGPREAGAVDLETLVMPGPVVQSHAKAEKDCAQCHPRFRKIEQKALCLECHEEVALDLESQRGFHGLHPGASTGDCRDCHTEHEGRQADIIGLDPETFDHERTDYPLHGAHQVTPCDSCHPSGDSPRDAPGDCVACHAEVDAHDGALGEGCGDCHDESAWSHAQFDHETTKFPLSGRHAEADCVLCHAGQRYEGVPTECGSCHRLDDRHAGRLGAACGDCHDTTDWQKVRFDHAAKADFPLEGGHRTVACAACHSEDPEKDELSRDCIGCHRPDDDHRGRFGEDCASCHSEDRWKATRFDHSTTDFPLRGGHQKADCEFCHTTTLFEQETDARCIACHQKDDVHEGQEGSDCSRCHDESGWETKVAFDHGLTVFPLLGLHAAVACEECHLTAAFKDADRRCSSCHEKDDEHERSLGSDCGTCHNPNGWRWWRFDHDERTSFALHGSHQDLECGACHQASARPGVNVSKSCRSCHARDDRHSGRMGRRCDLCHRDTRWDEVKR